MQCAACAEKRCYSEGKDCSPQPDLAKQVRQELRKKRNAQFCGISSILEAEHYMKLTRLDETALFARRMKFSHIGIAFCVGLSDEAKALHGILSKTFRVSSVCCKICGIDKKEMGLPNIKPDRYEAMCNPIGQAIVLNKANTDMNVILGLCVGHDMLFTRYSRAPVTTLVAKDRVLAHNPVAAMTNRYYLRKQAA